MENINKMQQAIIFQKIVTWYTIMKNTIYVNVPSYLCELYPAGNFPMVSPMPAFLHAFFAEVANQVGNVIALKVFDILFYNC